MRYSCVVCHKPKYVTSSTRKKYKIKAPLVCASCTRRIRQYSNGFRGEPVNLYDTTNVKATEKRYLSCGRCEDPDGDRERHADSCIMKMRVNRKAKGHEQPKDVSPGESNSSPGDLSPSVYDLDQWSIGQYLYPPEIQQIILIKEASICRIHHKVYGPRYGV